MKFGIEYYPYSIELIDGSNILDKEDLKGLISQSKIIFLFYNFTQNSSFSKIKYEFLPLIKEANEYLKEAGAIIKTIRGKGYTLLTSDQDAFLLWLHQQKLPARSLVPVMPEERVRFMMRKLLLLRLPPL